MTKKTIQRVQRVARVVCGLGFFFLLGSVGALELGNIGYGQFALQAAAGMLAFLGGGWLGGLLR